MKYYKILSFILFSLLLTSCIGNMNPTGGNSTPNYPYFITTTPITVKKIPVPVGTTLQYEEQFWKEGEQDKLMSERNLHTIIFPKGQPINWGGVPVTMINKFFNSEMTGYSVSGDFANLPEDKKTKFSKMWEGCDDDLGIIVKDSKDWTFNKKNIADVDDCSVLYQRYFKDDAEQQNFLNTMYAELMKVDSK